MSGAEFDIEHIATLARINLSADEKARLQGHLAAIIGYISQLNRLDTADVEPASGVFTDNNVFREDQATACFGDPEQFLRQAPQHGQGHFKVPQIIG